MVNKTELEPGFLVVKLQYLCEQETSLTKGISWVVKVIRFLGMRLTTRNLMTISNSPMEVGKWHH